MLYDFYHAQIDKSPGSLHATYLLVGKRLIQHQQEQAGIAPNNEGDDKHTKSSPLPASSAPEPQEHGQLQSMWSTVISLVNEEQIHGRLNS